MRLTGSPAFSAIDARAFLLAQGFGPCRVTVMEGGLWNRVFRAEGGGRTLTLKHYAALPEATLFPNLPEAEALALLRLDGLAVAPPLTGFWPEQRVLIYQHVDGGHWSGDPAPVAHLIRGIQSVQAEGFRPLPMVPEAILAEADTLFARCASDDLVRAWLALRPVPVFVPPAQPSLVHTDLGAGNLIGRGGGMRLIDWQCPGAGDAAEDVFSFLSPAVQAVNQCKPPDAKGRARFFQALDLPEVQARYTVLEPFFAYRHAAYCCLRRQTAPDLRALYTQAALAAMPAAADKYP